MAQAIKRRNLHKQRPAAVDSRNGPYVADVSILVNQAGGALLTPYLSAAMDAGAQSDVDDV